MKLIFFSFRSILAARLPQHWAGEVVTLFADMHKYPGYEGPLDPSGEVRVIFQENGMMEIKMYTFRGMEGSITNAGFHIHAGTSCDDAAAVGPHFWNPDLVVDLWTTEGGAVYTTLPHGKPIRGFHIFNGYMVEENAGHAVVAHALDGTRVACGILHYKTF